MPRSKKAASRGKRRESENGSRGYIDVEMGMPNLATSFVPFAGTSTRQKGDGQIFGGSIYPVADLIQGSSLQSEAFKAQRHQTSGNSDQRLRHAKVMFVSAGDSERSEVTEPETGLSLMTLNDTSKELQSDDRNTRIEMHLVTDRFVRGQMDLSSGAADDEKGPFAIDAQRSEPVITGIPPPLIRPISPAPSSSSSSDEVIVFAGRDKAGRGLSKPPKTKPDTYDFYDSRIRIIEDKIHGNQMLLDKSTNHIPQQSPFDSRHRLQGGISRENFSRTYQQRAALMLERKVAQKPYQSRARGHQSQKMKREQEQALIDDYISNMETQKLDLGLSFNQRDLGGTESDAWQEIETSSVEPFKISSLNEWGRLELGDLDAISTSDEFIGSVQAILSKRKRKSGQQYLVVCEHHTVDDARWVPSSSLTDVNSMKLAVEFEEEEKKLTIDISNNEDDSDSDADNDPISDEDDAASSDNADLFQQNIDSMADEKIAKLLAKQEELGMGSSELMLFDDLPEADLDGGRTKNHHMLKPTRGTFRSVPTKDRVKGNFQGTSALADSYDGFDVMDFERPSLKKKPKGFKGRRVVDLFSESELETPMAMARDKDRLRKRKRKEEREALRVQGLLGKKDTKLDLRAKYKEGMGIQAIKNEIRSFLMGDDTTLALPPMDKTNRKAVHELANAFSLKSKSAGNGNKRFPVLYRTQRTSSFSETRFAAVESRLTRRYLPRMDRTGRNSTSVTKRSGWGGIGIGAVGYRDGDIVGGSAPELGIENRGRAMLEKMGWSTGTALGALNNKGILQPVSHVVKTTKAGLG